MRDNAGPARVLLLGYGLFVVAAGGRSIAQLATHASRAPLSYALSAAAASIYLAGAVSIAAADRNVAWRRVSGGVFVVELSGVVAVGIWSVVSPEQFPDATVWSHFGSGYGFVPVALPVLGLLWVRGSQKAPDVVGGFCGGG